MKIPALVLALFMVTSTLFAQDGMVPVEPELDYKCLLATDEGAWMSLGLTGDQAKRAVQVRDACKDECAAAKTDGTVDKALVEGYETELRSILTTEQYSNWLVWCKDRAAKP